MSKHTKPQVSIITPYLNAYRFIDEFVRSIISQEYQHWICILIDDGSTDDSSSKLQSLTYTDQRFLLTKTPFNSGKGPASARNHGLSLAKTEFVAFCDIDDVWHPQKLRRQLAYHEKHCLDLSVTGYYRFVENQQRSVSLLPICPPVRLQQNLCYRPNPIPMLTAVCKTSFITHKFRSVNHEDFLFWIENIRSSPNFRYGCLTDGLAFYRCHQNNLTKNRFILPLWSYKVFRLSGLNSIESCWALICWFSGHLALSLRTGSFRRITVTSLNSFQDVLTLRR